MPRFKKRHVSSKRLDDWCACCALSVRARSAQRAEQGRSMIGALRVRRQSAQRAEQGRSMIGALHVLRQSAQRAEQGSFMIGAHAVRMPCACQDPSP